MSEGQNRGFTAIAGIIAVVLYAVSGALVFDLPSINDSAGVWSSYTLNHGTHFLAEVTVWGAVVAAVICFLVGLWTTMRQFTQTFDLLATVGLGAGLMIWPIVLAGFAPLLILGYRVSALDASSVKSLTDLALLGTVLSAWPTALSVAAFSVIILRTQSIGRWVGWFGFLVVAAHLVAAFAFAQTGFFSPGVMSIFVAPPAYFLWVLVISISVLRHPATMTVSAM